MRKPRILIVAALSAVAAAALVLPGGMASAATSAPAQPAAVTRATTGVTLLPLKTASKASPSAVNPECKLFFLTQQGKPGGLAHISSFLLSNHKIRAVKINAQIQCRRVSTDVFLQVTLWKTGAIFPHKQAGPETATAAKTNSLKNQKTWRECANTKKSTFYGTSYARVVFQGVTYTASLQSGKATLTCGT